MASVLLVSDRVEWCFGLAARLQSGRFRVVIGEDVLPSSDEKDGCDLAIVDLQARSPLEVCSELRASIPVLAVHAEAGDVLVLPAYEAGADMVVPEDLGTHELLSRVRALLRNRPRTRPAAPRAPMTFDSVSRTVLVPAGTLHLTVREYETFAMLASVPGRVVTRQELTAGWTVTRVDRSLDFVIRRLRAKLETVHHPERIVVVRGYGYRLVPALAVC